ncbi:hypothetical protein I4U23_012227 [Adineta vaga]|nr:hypothetical protein I4U23_012227 [Adineta vaga]
MFQRLNAFIITYNCASLRFNITKTNIERVFPNYFHIYCFQSIPLNDSRIHLSSSRIAKKFSSNLLSFVNVWTHEIPKYSKNNELQWSFIFEDDVNFVNPSNFSLRNYIHPLEDMMKHPEIHLKDGLFYLGICGPKFSNKTHRFITNISNRTILSSKAFGWCAHAMGLTTKRARNLWFDISLYRPNPEGSIDSFVREYSIRSKSEYYVLGSNLHWPPKTGHYGIAYQDRARFHSEMN